MHRSIVGIALIVVAFHGSHVTAQNHIHVDPQAAQSPHDGSNWQHACLRVSDALSVAGPGSVVRIAGGTYLPDTTGLGDPRDAAFTLPPGIIIEGGYAGAAGLDPNARNTVVFETRLSGDIGLPNVVTDNCYHVLLGTSADAGTVLDGVTITGGNADGAGARGQGGGVLLGAAGPTFRDCTITQNSAAYGGGVFNQGGHPTFERVAFIENFASASGGAMYNYQVFAPPGVDVVDCQFIDNTAFSNGGAVRNWDSAANFRGCTFTSNHTQYGGAAVANGGQGAVEFLRCIFDANRTDTLFALHDSYGGAMHNTDETQTTARSCLFKGNRAIASLPGLSHGGAIANSGNAQPAVTNCTFVDNDANIGRGVFNEGQSAAVVKSSILWNGGDEIVLTGAATADVQYSTVTGSWPGTGNLATDPQLSDERPQAGSPCINAGNPGFASATEADLDGHARVLCNRVDMGAFEFGIGDFNCDELANLDDFSNWNDCMTGPNAGPYAPDCVAFDYGFDGDIDLQDYASFSIPLGE